MATTREPYSRYYPLHQQPRIAARIPTSQTYTPTVP